jgi:hypothetical protein
MKYLKLVIISIVVLFMVLVFLFALFPNHIRISRVINISSSAKRVSQVVGDMADWGQWNQFVKLSNGSGASLSNPSAGQGAYLKTAQLTISIVQDQVDTVATRWEPANGQKFTGGFAMLQTSDSNTVVEWYFDFYSKWYPWEKLGIMFYDKQMGPLMEKSLVDLKTYTENR